MTDKSQSAIEAEVLKLLKNSARLQKLAETARKGGISRLQVGPLSMDLLQLPGAVLSQNKDGSIAVQDLPPNVPISMAPADKLTEEQKLEELLFWSTSNQ